MIGGMRNLWRDIGNSRPFRFDEIALLGFRMLVVAEEHQRDSMASAVHAGYQGA